MRWINADSRRIHSIASVRPTLLKYAQQNAPRYTSYPTAPHFTPAVDGEVYRQWLNELPSDASVSLYIHTPYCAQMCWYCGCHAFSVNRDEPIAAFVETLQREIAMVGEASRAKRVTELHWGGGTPNTLSPERFEAINAGLARCFDLSSLERHAVEIDPRLLTAEHVAAFTRCGVNRASLGVQDLDPGVQSAIGRVQPLDTVQAAVTLLRKGGIDSISFDLIYGLPRQTRESVRRTVEQAIELKPARFSVFGYAHVPWFKQRQRLIDDAQLPGAEARFALADEIRTALTSAGYVEIGYDHFALPGDTIAQAARDGALQRNFQGFVESECDALIGLGPSAISTLPQGYAQNATNVTTWREQIADGRLAISRGIPLSRDDKLRRALIMRLVCDFEIDLDAFGGATDFKEALERLQPLARDGLVQIDGAKLTIPREARAFVRLVARAFDAYSDTTARHSAAV